MKTKTPFETWLDDIDNEDLCNDILLNNIAPYDDSKHDLWKRFARKIYDHEQKIIARYRTNTETSGGKND